MPGEMADVMMQGQIAAMSGLSQAAPHRGNGAATTGAVGSTRGVEAAAAVLAVAALVAAGAVPAWRRHQWRLQRDGAHELAAFMQAGDVSLEFAAEALTPAPFSVA